MNKTKDQMHLIRGVLVSLRPRQWSKNLLVFAGVIFSQNMLNPFLLFKSFLAFLVFCFLSGASYLFNDIIDMRADSVHPGKHVRPLASGALSPDVARIAYVALAVFFLSLSLAVSKQFFFITLVFVCLQAAYSLILKHIIIVDIIAIACCFLLRVMAGGAAVGVLVSNWLVTCTVFLAVFLILGKRRYECLLLGSNAEAHRRTLGKYSVRFLDRMILVFEILTVAAYSLYTVSNHAVSTFGSFNLVYTIPFVLLGIFRYRYLIYYKSQGGEPDSTLLMDKILLISIMIWIVTVMGILYGHFRA